MMAVHEVGVTPAVALPGDKRGGLELGHDALYGPLGDPDLIGDIPQADLRILGEAKQTCAWLVRKVQSRTRSGTGLTLRGQDKAGSRTMVQNAKMQCQAHDARGTTQAAEVKRLRPVTWRIAMEFCPNPPVS
jgi:hypothetical protein